MLYKSLLFLGADRGLGFEIIYIYKLYKVRVVWVLCEAKECIGLSGFEVKGFWILVIKGFYIGLVFVLPQL